MSSIGALGQAAAAAVRRSAAYNILASQIGRSEMPVAFGRSPVRRMITRVLQGEELLTERDHEAVLEIVSRSTRSIAETSPERLTRLRADIELATLELLIVEFADMLGGEFGERCWQDFFSGHPFILSLVFGHPVIKIHEQAHLGGRSISGPGETIADFLFANSLTDNTAIVEIKTPQTSLLNTAFYRTGVYGPSSELSSGVNQVLNQRYQLQRNILMLRGADLADDLESYAVHCCLIVGTMPAGRMQQRSFELFRQNSRDVEIVTFDELLAKLKQFHRSLSLTQDESG